MACAGPDENKVKRYYDVTGFVDSLVKRLQTQDLKLERLAQYEDESTRITIEQIDWKKELDIFKELDPNRPQYDGLLGGDTLINDQYTIIRYINPNAKGLIMLTIESDLSGNVMRLKGKLQNENLLFSTTKELALYLNDQKSHVLDSFRISGSQKIILKGKVNYDTRNHVRF
jgi:hypothetical protein